MESHTPQIPPYLGIAIGILAVSTASIFIRYAQADGAPSLVIAAYRITLATLILIPYVLRRNAGELQTLTGRQWTLAVTSGAFLGLHFGAWISSLAYTSVASSVVMVNTSPLFVAVISALALREKLTAPTVVGIGIALTGGIIIASTDACGAAGCPPLADLMRGRAIFGDGLALVGAVAAAVYLAIGRSLRTTVSLGTYVLVTYGTAAIVLVLVVLGAGLPIVGYAPVTYTWFTLLALIPQLIGHSSFNWALRYLPATIVSVAVLGEPIGSTVLAVFLLREWPSPLKLIGGAVILAGIFVASWRTATPAPEAA